MRLPRFRLRTLMPAVAAVAVLCAAESMRRRSVAFRGEAAIYAELEREALRLADGHDKAAAHAERKATQEVRMGRRGLRDPCWAEESRRHAESASDFDGRSEASAVAQ
jgi:hypothetical protein